MHVNEGDKVRHYNSNPSPINNEMSSIDLTKLCIEKLSKKNIYLTEGFDCGDDNLNEFICEKALKYQEGRIATTYLCVYKGEFIGYYAIVTGAIKMSGKDKRLLDRLGKGQRDYPSLKIARIGVKKGWNRKGIGTYMVKSIVGIATKISEDVGCRYVTADAYDKPVPLNFYKRNKFKFLKKEKKGGTIPVYKDIMEPIETD